MRLYDAPLSGNCHKIRMLMAFLGLEYEKVAVDTLGGGTQTAAFLQLNPRGQVPVLQDGERTVWDSQAILVYLAREYGAESWLPLDTDTLTRILQWLAVSENELLYGLARARAVLKLGRSFDLQECQAVGQTGLRVLEDRLRGAEWLAAAHITIADIACYPYVALAPEGDIDLAPYPGVRAWLARIQRQPGYEDMPGMARFGD